MTAPQPNQSRSQVPSGLMSEPDSPRLPRGRPPWDPWNGARIGALAGGLLGVGAAVLLGSSNYLAVPVVAAIGAFVGYRSQKRKQETDRHAT